MIHPHALVDPTAEIGDNVTIGPFTVIGPDVVIGAGSKIESHVVVKGPTQIGRNCHIFQYSTVGEATPDLKYKGEPTRLVIGDNNVIREGVTIHRGTVQDRSETTIGDNNLIMAYVHIGHDSVVGNNCILVNNASLAGHVHLGDWAILSGYTLIHQYCKIGAHAFVSAGGYITQDIPAYVMVAGNPPSPRTVNAEGLKRRGFSKEQIAAITKAYKLFFRRGLQAEEALAQIAELPEQAALKPFVDGIRSSTRGILR